MKIALNNITCPAVRAMLMHINIKGRTEMSVANSIMLKLQKAADEILCGEKNVDVEFQDVEFSLIKNAYNRTLESGFPISMVRGMYLLGEMKEFQ